LTKVGEFIHALEDSYAHQADEHKRDFSKRFNALPLERVIDSWWFGLGHGFGHGLHGHHPDQTWRRPDLAMVMAQDVHREMMNLCSRYVGTACTASSFESIRPTVYDFVIDRPQMYVQYVIGGLVPVEDVIDYSAKIRKLDSTYKIDPDEWAIRHEAYLDALSHGAKNWIGHQIYHDPKVIKGVVTNPDPNGVSGCKCWIGLGE
jgi:hypothetical protein